MATNAGDQAEVGSTAEGFSVGMLVQAWRERALLTQEQLADRSGLSVRTIRRLETRDAAGRPRSGSLRMLSDALGLNDAERAALAAAAHGTAAQPSGGGSSDRQALSPSDEVPRQLPAPPPVFTGRAGELAGLGRVPDAAAVVITAIDGMAGIGKTALALHTAHQLVGDYPDGQLFVDLHGHTKGLAPVEPADALERLLRALGVSGPQIPAHLEDRAALYRSRLADRKVLILLDNAASEGQVRPLLPGTPGCLVVVTSRHRLAGLDHTHTLSLDVLPVRDAVALFTATVGEDRAGRGSSAELVEVVELCGRLPLAIRIAAARLKAHSTWPVGHLAARLRDHQHRLVELEAGERGVAAALDVSYEHLEPDLQWAYRAGGLHPGEELDVYAVAALTHSSAPQAGRWIDHLLDAHLLHEPTPGRYGFHDLVRAHAATIAARHDTENARQAALTRLFDYYRSTASVAMDVAYPLERESRPRTQPIKTPAPVLGDSTQAAAWLDTELQNLLATTNSDDGRWPEHTIDLSATLHHHLRTRGHSADAEALHRRALAAARATGSTVAELSALTDLGHIRRLQGRTEQAIADLTGAVKIARSTGDSAREMNALIGLGNCDLRQGRYEQAANRFEQALALSRVVGDQRSEMYAQRGLAGIDQYLSRPEQAAIRLAQAREVAHAIGDLANEVEALSSIGWLECQNARYEQAISHLEQALDIAHAIGSRFDEAKALAILGQIHRIQGHQRPAADCYHQLLTIAEETGGGNWRFEALHGMGRLHTTAGRLDLGLTCLHRALDLAQELGQPEDQIRAHDALAHAQRALDNHEQARQHWRHALQLLTDLGVDHTEEPETTTATIRAHLASLDRTPNTP